MTDDPDPLAERGTSAACATGSGVIEVSVHDRTGRMNPGEIGELSALIEACLRHVRARGEVRVGLVDDLAMSAAHQQYSRVAGTTDVLTFDLRDLPDGPLDADILVCVDEAARRAAERGHPVGHELVLYALHGVLHCLGEDDHDEQSAARMHQREDEVLAAIGLGRVFAAGPSADGGRA